MALSYEYILVYIFQKCATQLPIPAEADAHYKAVCRALVAEALELSKFLEKIAEGTHVSGTYSIRI